jgi:hypothetical protein
MADSDALRSRRKRLHAAGDHHLCHRCDARSGAVVVPPAGDGAAVDARVMLEALARRLEAAHEADPADAQVARVLQSCLVVLMGPEQAVDGELAKFFAEFSGA